MLFLVVVLCVIGVVDLKIRPVIEDMAEYQAHAISERAINQAVSDELKEENLHYDDIVVVRRDDKGMVTSIETDMIGMNGVKSNITSRIAQYLGNIEDNQIRIPLGTFSGSQFFSGLGPELTFKFVPAGYVETKLENRFEAAGINQTRHQIMMKIEANITTILPGYRGETKVETNFCIAETIIVGAIPESFTNVQGDNDSVTRKIFDYGDTK